MKEVKNWLQPLDERLFLEGIRQKIINAMKGQESEKKLITLLPTEKLKITFHEKIESYMKATLKEQILSRDDMEHLLLRKLFELTNPNSEYDIILFQKVKNRWIPVDCYIIPSSLKRKHQLFIILNLKQ